MKILSPSEYKLKQPNAYLGDYLTYLESAQQELEETLANAKNFTLSTTVIDNIQKQAEEILRMSKLIEEYMGQIVLGAVDNLSLEELQSYFNFEELDKISIEKKANLTDEKEKIYSRLAEIDREIDNTLYANGRIKDFYQEDDTKEFFKEYPTPDKYLQNWLEKEAVAETNCIKDLRNIIELTILAECEIQNVELNSAELNALCDNLVELFRKSLNIVKFSSGASEEVVRVILSESGIKKYLPDLFDDNTNINLINDMMNLIKFDTKFYKNLPEALRKNLATERLKGKSYEILLKTYQAFLNNEELPNDDLSLDEKQERQECVNRIEQIGHELDVLDREQGARMEFLNNKEEMCSSLKTAILETIEDKVTSKDIDTLIKTEDEKADKLKSDLVASNDLLFNEIKNLERAKTILIDPNYHEFFQAVEFNNVRKVYRNYGVGVTDEAILPYLEAEKRRFEQLEIMVNLQNKLSDIDDIINKLKNRTHKFIKYLPFYKKKIQDLDIQYLDMINESFKELKEKNLFYVDAPQISDESTVGNIIILPMEDRFEPKSFSELSRLSQTLWNMQSGIDENTKGYILSKNLEFDNWEDYYQNLIEEYSSLMHKLFDFEMNEEKHYNFASSKEERERLLCLQQDIIEILSSVYEERKAFRNRLGNSDISLDADKVLELESLLGVRANLSRENLANYIELTVMKIAKLKSFLSHNYATCLDLGIQLYPGISATEDTGKEKLNELNMKIQMLKINGVNNLEDAIAYRDLLLALEEYTVPDSQVKDYYLKYRKN